MKQLLEQYADYNLWANKKINEQLSKLSHEQINQPVVSSFPSIHKTMVHLLEVENAWLERLNSQPASPSGWFKGNFDELQKKLISISTLWQNFVVQASEEKLKEEFAYKNTKGDHFVQPIFQMLLHLFNHQTFHRGQIITMLRQLGVDKISPVDFIVFSRSPNNLKV